MLTTVKIKSEEQLLKEGWGLHNGELRKGRETVILASMRSILGKEVQGYITPASFQYGYLYPLSVIETLTDLEKEIQTIKKEIGL